MSGTIIMMTFAVVVALLSFMPVIAVKRAEQAVVYDDYMSSKVATKTMEGALREAMHESLSNNSNDLRLHFDYWIGIANEGLAEGEFFSISSVEGVVKANSDFPLFVPGQVVQPLMEPSVESRLMASPIESQTMGDLVAEGDTIRVEVDREFYSLTGKYKRKWLLESKIVSVPLCRWDILEYVLPSELGSVVDGSRSQPNALGGVTVFPGGLLSDSATLSELGSGALPYVYRSRVSAVSNAVQRVFSGEYLQRVQNYCGPTHIVNIEKPLGVENPVPVGVSLVGPSEYEIDLGVVEESKYVSVSGEYTESRDALFVFANSAGGKLSLVEGPLVSDVPLLLMLVGPPDSTATLQVELDSSLVTRPLVLVCFNVSISSGGTSMTDTAMILDVESSISSGSVLEVSSVAYSYDGDSFDGADVSVTGNLSDGTRHLVPRGQIVLSKGVSQ